MKSWQSAGSSPAYFFSRAQQKRQRQYTRLRLRVSDIHTATAVLILALSPIHAQAQAWPEPSRHVADVVSYGLVGANLTADTIDSWLSEDKGAAFRCQALRTGLTIGAAELVKRIAKRARPDGSDRLSFYSEHSALAMVSAGWRLQVGIPIAFGSGYLRLAADKHHVDDVLVGLVAGFWAGKVCRA